MTDPNRAPTIARIPLTSPADGGLAALVASLGACDADYVLPAPADLRAPAEALAAMARAAAADPAAAAFRMPVRGLTPDTLWRGRRCRSHERNLESLRFADIIPPGGLLIRREALLAALVGLPAGLGDDAWRVLCRRIGRAGRIADLDITLRRAARMPGERARPGFAPLRPSQVLILGQIEVSTSLYFDFLDASPDFSIDFRPLTRLALDAPVLAGADLVILVRELHRFWDEGVISFLDAAGVPYVWFTDDNFPVLRAEGEASGFYALPRMCAALARAAAVWTSTEALAAAHGSLHPNVEVWKPALDPALRQPAPAPAGPLTVALAGGDFRLPGLAGSPMERLREIAGGPGLRLIVTPAAAQMLRPALPAAEIIVQPPERSFRQFVRAWRRFGPDILLHLAGATANAPFKTPTAAIVAGYLGAVPVLAAEPAYQDWSEADGVLPLGSGSEGISIAADAARRPEWRADMGQRLAEALAARFGVEGRAARLRALMRPTPRRDPVAVAENILDSPGFARGHAVRRIARLARPISDRVRPPG
jgi:hypothetical protein